jgi:hypothetical protein
MPQNNPPLPPNMNPNAATPLGSPPVPPPTPNFGQNIIQPPGNGGSGQQYQIRWEPTFNTPFTPGPPTTPPYKIEQPPTTDDGEQPLTGPKIIGVIDDCMRSVTVFDKNVPRDIGGIIDVFVNSVWRGSAIVNDNYNEVPLSICSLKIGDSVQASITFNGSTVQGNTVRVVSHVPYSVLTAHYNNGRTGWYPYAGLTWNDPPKTAVGNPPLTTSNVPLISEQMNLKMPTDGKAFAQPLYMHHQFFPNLGPINPGTGKPFGEAHNVIFLATEMGSVFAYDADNSQGLWQRSQTNLPNLPAGAPLLPPGFTLIKTTIIKEDNLHQPYSILSTPVIDCGCSNGSGSGSGSSGCDCCQDCGCQSAAASKGTSNCGCCRTATIYVVTYCQRGVDDPPNTDPPLHPTFHFFLHALDVTTGENRSNSPVEITGQVNGTAGTPFDPVNSPNGFLDGTGSNDGKGHVIFVPRYHQNRPGLLLLNGTIYIGFASHGDNYEYHGWIFSYDALTLEQKNIFCTTPDGSGAITQGGIWQSGCGLASDGKAIYCTTGNGTFDGVRDFGDTVLKLSPDLTVLSWFAPANNDVENATDSDLGSGGVMIIPSDAISSPNLLVTAGKDGQVFLLDRTNLGGFVAPQPGSDGYNSNNNPNSVQTILIRDGVQISNVSPDYDPGVWGGPAYYNGPKGPLVFYCSNGDADPTLPYLPQLVGFSLNNSRLEMTTWNNKDIFPSGGSTPVVSSDQQTDKTGVVWVVQRDIKVGGQSPHQLSLKAYDATNLGASLLSLPCGTWANRALIEPVIINGKVYVASEDHVSVFF